MIPDKVKVVLEGVAKQDKHIAVSKLTSPKSVQTFYSCRDRTLRSENCRHLGLQ